MSREDDNFCACDTHGCSRFTAQYLCVISNPEFIRPAHSLVAFGNIKCRTTLWCNAYGGPLVEICIQRWNVNSGFASAGHCLTKQQDKFFEPRPGRVCVRRAVGAQIVEDLVSQP